MTICVFLGPSFPVADAQAILPAVYLPPARRGDVFTAIRSHDAEAVALIDGVFEQAPSVWHKELLWALDKGVRLYGAASMGALRAAELSQFGMTGIGRIYDAYTSGRFAPFDDPFEDDDEVAVVHGPAEIGYAASDAMVDIRATLAAAAEAGVIGPDEMRSLARAAKALFYKRRIWSAVLDAGHADDALREWLPQNRVSQKRLDAGQLLRHLRDGGGTDARPAFRFERTLLWEQAAADMTVREPE